jgi:hypothetical protein
MPRRAAVAPSMRVAAMAEQKVLTDSTLAQFLPGKMTSTSTQVPE